MPSYMLLCVHVQVLCEDITKANIDAVITDLLHLYDLEAKCIWRTPKVPKRPEELFYHCVCARAWESGTLRISRHLHYLIMPPRGDISYPIVSEGTGLLNTECVYIPNQDTSRCIEHVITSLRKLLLNRILVITKDESVNCLTNKKLPSINSAILRAFYKHNCLPSMFFFLNFIRTKCRWIMIIHKLAQ